MLSTTDPDAEPNSLEVDALEELVVGGALAGAAAAAMTGFRATYRLQLGGDFGFAAARELVPYLADLGVSHLYLPPSFQARPGSTHGYDVVDPTSISEELGGEAEFRALDRRRPRGGVGRDPRHRPEPHGGRRRQPLLDRAALEVLRRRRGDREVPPLLRHRPPRGRPAGGPGGVRGDPPPGHRVVRRRFDRRAADRPPGRAGGSAGLPRAAARRRRRARVGGEDPRPRREAAVVVAGRGDGRLRVPQRCGRALRGPLRPRPSHGPVARPLRRPAAVLGLRRRGQAGAGLHHLHRGGGTPRAQLPPRRPARGPLLVAGLPHVHP